MRSRSTYILIFIPSQIHIHTHINWKIERIEGSGGEEAFIHVLDSRSAHTLHQEMGKSRKPGTRAFTTAGRGAARRYHLLLVSSSVSPRESRMLAVISANYIRRAPFLLDAAVVAICLWKEIKKKKKKRGKRKSEKRRSWEAVVTVRVTFIGSIQLSRAMFPISTLEHRVPVRALCGCGDKKKEKRRKVERYM